MCVSSRLIAYVALRARASKCLCSEMSERARLMIQQCWGGYEAMTQQRWRVVAASIGRHAIDPNQNLEQWCVVQLLHQGECATHTRAARAVLGHGGCSVVVVGTSHGRCS